MTRDDALSWLADLFEESADTISPETQRPDVSGWDSLGVLTLMAGLDDEFDIRLTEDEMLELNTIGDILAILEKHEQLT